MRVKCLFFAQSREVVGFGSHSFDVREGINTEEFKSKYLFPLFPVLEESFEVFFFLLLFFSFLETSFSKFHLLKKELFARCRQRVRRPGEPRVFKGRL